MQKSDKLLRRGTIETRELLFTEHRYRPNYIQKLLLSNPLLPQLKSPKYKPLRAFKLTGRIVSPKFSNEILRTEIAKVRSESPKLESKTKNSTFSVNPVGARSKSVLGIAKMPSNSPSKTSDLKNFGFKTVDNWINSQDSVKVNRLIPTNRKFNEPISGHNLVDKFIKQVTKNRRKPIDRPISRGIRKSCKNNKKLNALIQVTSQNIAKTLHQKNDTKTHEELKIFENVEIRTHLVSAKKVNIESNTEEIIDHKDPLENYRGSVYTKCENLLNTVDNVTNFNARNRGSPTYTKTQHNFVFKRIHTCNSNISKKKIGNYNVMSLCSPRNLPSYN